MSKTTCILFGLAIICYSLAWTQIATVFGLFGFLFEMFMYISWYADSKKEN